MGLTDILRSIFIPPPAIVPNPTWPYVNFTGGPYGLTGLQTTLPGAKAEDIGGDFRSLAAVYQTNGVVFACMLARLMIFSEARFQFQRFDKGRPGDLFGDDSLDILEHPWPGGTTGDLLMTMLADADTAGNSFIVHRGTQLVRLAPDWVTIVAGSPSGGTMWSTDAAVMGYVYHPGGRYSGEEPEFFLREEVAHFRPIPDPLSRFRGMSWLTPVIREIMADGAASAHKLKFFENGGTPNMVIKRDDAVTGDVFKEWVTLMREGNEGLANAYKTLYLSAGADAVPVGADMKQLDFKVVQGAGETRIASAAGMHPVIVGLSEGMQGSSLNAGNFNSARRLVADRTMSPLWRNAAGSLEVLVPPPSRARLWWDGRDIPFLREDRKDAAEIENLKADAVVKYVDKGFTRESAVIAVNAENMTLLKPDPDWVSVQVQAANAAPPTTEPVPTNGKAPSGVIP